MVPIDLVQIPSLTLLFLDEHVQIELQKFRDQASLFYNYFGDLIMKSEWETKDLHLKLSRGETKTFGEGCWWEDYCMAGQNKEFKWLNTNFKNSVEYATNNAK